MIKILDGEVGAIRNKYGDLPTGNIVDLGGGQDTLGSASVVVDLTRVPSVGRFVQGDLCDARVYQQFHDKEFDWAWCNHTLEDLYDPFTVLRESQRIAKHGLFGMPHWTREVTIQSNRPDWENVCGWPHHFWIAGINRQTGILEFFPKMCWLVAGERPYTTANLNFEWDGGDLPYANIYLEYTGDPRRDALIGWLEQRWFTE